jgi:hypothetical protein
MNVSTRWCALVLAGNLLGCAGGLPAVHPYNPNTGYFDDVSQKTGDPGYGGRDFCKRVEMSARTNSVAHRTFGWISGVFALAAAGAGAGVAATDQPESGGGKNRYKVAVVTLPLAAGLLAYLSSGQFTMSGNSSALASASAVGANGEDAAANATCNSAIATWNSDSAAATAAFAAAVGKLNQAKQAESDANKAEQDAAKVKAEAEKATEDLKTQQKEKAGTP